jgi:hypothetical protein
MVPVDAIPRMIARVIKNPFQPISPVTKLEGHELRRLSGPMLILCFLELADET